MITYKPLFILSNPRSGSSLLRIMLTLHPNICIPPECGFIQWWHDKYKHWSTEHSKSLKKIASFLDDLKKSKKIETWDLDFESLKNLINNLLPKDYSELCLLVIFQYAQKFGKNCIYLGDKNNYYINHLTTLNQIFPEAFYLMIIRDGRDVACSYQEIKQLNSTSNYKPNLPTEISEIATEWQNNNQNILSFLENKSSDRYYICKYEDLIQQTKNTLFKICQWLELPFSEKMLEYFKKNEQELLEPTELLAWKMKTLQEPDPSNIHKYKNILSEQEIFTFEKITGSFLKKLGYE